MNSISEPNNKVSFIESLQTSNDFKIPFWELEFHLWNKFEYGDIVLGYEILKKSKDDQIKSLYKNAEIITNVSHELGFSAVTIPGSYWELSPGKPAYYWLPDELGIKQAEILQEVCDINLIVNVGGILAIPSAENYMDFSINLLENPDAIDKIAKESLEQAKSKINLYSDLGFRYFLTASDLADNSGPFFPPNEFNRFILPYLNEWSELIHKKNGFAILHSDGDLNIYIDQLAESGIDALQAIDPIAGMDMKKLIQKLNNKIALCGNIDCGFLLTNDEESIYNEVSKLLLNYFKEGPFIFGASNAVQSEIKKENYLAMVASLRDFNSNLK